MFEKANERVLKTGIDKIDELISIGEGIITLKCEDNHYLFWLISNLIVRNQNEKPILYLHWVDYYKRYWTLDFQLISDLAKKTGNDIHSISENVFFLRAFSRDAIEEVSNWKTIFNFGDINFAILDSVSDLFDANKSVNTKSMTYALGMFSRFCIKNRCVGVVLDTSKRVHPFLGNISSVIINFRVGEKIFADVLKHGFMGEKTVEICNTKEINLGRWLNAN